ncbi:MAG: DUF2018 domain-containing protein [Epsilonproteobacteria bacterium]|jgi:hypothetical protein|nr:DUF2018 domain-containing protein [Campylobacterota bacterium]NPA89280.1 DUF2018 family protein [Campylobacterota bacterium]
MDFFDENKTPADKFFEILYHANRNLVREELENLIERMAVLEVLAEECFGDDLEQKIMETRFSKSDQVEGAKEDIYIHTMSQILTKNE